MALIHTRYECNLSCVTRHVLNYTHTFLTILPGRKKWQQVMPSNSSFEKSLQRLASVGILTLVLPVLVRTIVSRRNMTSTENILPFYCAYCICQDTPDGIITNCSRKGLFNPPRNLDVRTSELFLPGNWIKTVNYSRLTGLYNIKVLDLSDNKISTIEIGAFRDLSNLTHLYLNDQNTKSDLFILQNVFKPGVFEGLSSLNVLHVHNCLETVEAYTSTIPSEALKELTALEELRIDGVVNATFNESFNLLKNLSKVVMSGFEGTCQIGHLDRKSFVGLENVKNLTINKCRIRTSKTGTFWWTPKLEYLDMSWNTELEINQFGRILEELKYTNLQILKINAIHNPDRAGTEILRPDVKYLRDIKLIEMFMDDNGIEFVDYGVFDMFPKSLKRLYLRRNKLNFGLYLYEAVFNNPNLEVLDAGDQALVTRYDKSSRTSIQPITSRQRRTPINSFLEHRYKLAKRSQQNPILNLNTLICSGSMSSLHILDFNGTVNNLTVMDLSRNFIPKLSPNGFEGLYQMKYLNLSDNYIEDATTSAFNGLYSVEVMDLENNLLGYTLEDDELGQLFSPLVRMKSMYLSKNRIKVLGKNVFNHATDLEILDLSDNFIEHLDIEISRLSKLKVLDLSYNKLDSLPSGVRTHLSTLSNYHNVRINLSNNKLICNCENIPFLKWLFYSKVEFQNIENYYCSLQNNSIRVFNESSRFELLKELEQDCKSYLGIIVGGSTGSAIVLTFLASYLIYRKRWNLQYVYYMAKLKLDHTDVDTEADHSFCYDVFVSYGDGDRSFVINDMLQNLEVDKGKRLNVRDRDFELGEVIAVNISKAIRTSKKTFLLLSRHFLRNKWCNFEMNMARIEAVHMKRQVIVIIFLETIPTTFLPLEIMDLLRECPNMDLPKDNALRTAFWQKCLDQI